jgi:hypothetical protein
MLDVKEPSGAEPFRCRSDGPKTYHARLMQRHIVAGVPVFGHRIA